jgi:hypothetical protein
MMEATSPKPNLAALALQIAISQIGQQETPKGSNRGPMVDKYQIAAGLALPAKGNGFPWCQSFMYWCLGEAAKQLSIPNPMPRTAGVLDCWNKTATSTKFFQLEAMARPNFILPGMQFIMKEGPTIGHTGIVEKVIKSPRGWEVHTVEGNTNDEGSREGYEVCRRVRKVSSSLMLGYIRYDIKPDHAPTMQPLTEKKQA